jgi:hypothetical protein
MVSAVRLSEFVSLYRGDGESKEDGNKEREGKVLGVYQHSE